MKRNTSHPQILPFPATDAKSAAVPRGGERARRRPINRLRCLADAPAEPADHAALARMRDKLFRMIIENERVRWDGPRAS